LKRWDYIVVFITCAKKAEAEKISEELVRNGLAACVNVVPEISSIFSWKGKLEKSGELLLMAKTRLSSFEELEKRVKAMHSYEVPEIIALPIACGNDAYMNWLDEVLARPC